MTTGDCVFYTLPHAIIVSYYCIVFTFTIYSTFENYNDIKLLDNERYKNRLLFLKELDKKNLIIIDNMDITRDKNSHDLYRELEELSCDIIITTRTKDLFPVKYMYEIHAISIENQLLNPW